jgi:type I site-specific restriction endonuclease
MSLLNIPAYDSSTESDVEQKFIFPLLTHPSFLAIPAKIILTKKSMGTLSFVEKTTLPRNYIPDYVVFFHGLPVCVVEAKAPDVPVQQAIAEARLYADTLNKQFPTRINPIEVVVGCNGREIAVGPVDTNDADVFSVSDIVIGSTKLEELKPSPIGLRCSATPR